MTRYEMGMLHKGAKLEIGKTDYPEQINFEEAIDYMRAGKSVKCCWDSLIWRYRKGYVQYYDDDCGEWLVWQCKHTGFNGIFGSGERKAVWKVIDYYLDDDKPAGNQDRVDYNLQTKEQ